MTKRAKRLAAYLENDLGWTVFEDTTQCGGCGERVFGYPYCPKCGTKQGKPTSSRKDVLADIEKAIAYAVDDA